MVSDREGLADPAEIVQPTIGATSHGTAPGAETVARWALAAMISSGGVGDQGQMVAIEDRLTAIRP
ncbi:hypothetical protein BJF90_21525 [Pseudonocardia sp. CNS-004]|nr:hypothetical protein BJF90_21525 [Pseudonocardia sp. CNS-004]